MSKWRWILQQYGQRLWVRVWIFCLASVAAALAGTLVDKAGSLPQVVSVDAGAVSGILNILASSMLAVTTFSLSIMVSAYSAAASSTTPRANKLMLRDNTSQNALSVFIGAFLFSLAGIIGLSSGLYGDGGRLVLFLATLGVVVLIVVVLIGWINYLSRLGRVGETIDLVERATKGAMQARGLAPCLGGCPASEGSALPPGKPLVSSAIGYIQYIDMAGLSQVAEACKLEVHLQVLPGHFNDSIQPLMHVTGNADDEACAALAAAVTIGDERSFDQDPRFGLVVLSEIACRALSPAVNDPGTAIDVIGTGLRLMGQWLCTHAEKEDEIKFLRVHVPALKLCDMFEDLFWGIARDGAANVAVGVRLQKAFLALAQMEGGKAAQEAAFLSRIACQFSDAALVIEADRKRIGEIAAEVQSAADGKETA